MRAIRFGASFLALAILLGLCVFLYGPARELPLLNVQGSIGPGALPVGVVVGVAILSLLVAVTEVRKLLGREADAALAEASLIVSARSFVWRSAAVIAMLAGYAALWKMTHFVPASMAFFAVLGLFLLEPEQRTFRTIAATLVVAVIFAPAIWFAFERLLGVPLR